MHKVKHTRRHIHFHVMLQAHTYTDRQTNTHTNTQTGRQTHYHNWQFLGQRGKGMVSLMLGVLRTNCRKRSKPRPKPPWGLDPNCLRSRYLKRPAKCLNQRKGRTCRHGDWPSKLPQICRYLKRPAKCLNQRNGRTCRHGDWPSYSTMLPEIYWITYHELQYTFLSYTK